MEINETQVKYFEGRETNGRVVVIMDIKPSQLQNNKGCATDKAIWQADFGATKIKTEMLNFALGCSHNPCNYIRRVTQSGVTI